MTTMALMRDLDQGIVATHDVDTWRVLVAERLEPLSIAGAQRAKFNASVDGGVFDQVRIARISTQPHAAERTDRLAQMGDPYYWVTYQCKGTSSIEQAGRRSLLREGDFTVYDSSMPYRREFKEYSETLVLMIPQQRIMLPPRVIASISAVRIDGNEGLGAVVSAFLGGLSGHIDDLRADHGHGLIRAAVELVTAAFADQFGLVAQTPANRRLEQLISIREWMLEHLGDCNLCPAQIAQAHFISVRQLHLLFEEQGTTVGTWMRERRLDMARRDLESPCETAPIGQIAARWGFNDPGYFARAFKQAYGRTPREYRRLGAGAED